MVRSSQKKRDNPQQPSKPSAPSTPLKPHVNADRLAVGPVPPADSVRKYQDEINKNYTPRTIQPSFGTEASNEGESSFAGARAAILKSLKLDRRSFDKKNKYSHNRESNIDDRFSINIDTKHEEELRQLKDEIFSLHTMCVRDGYFSVARAIREKFPTVIITDIKDSFLFQSTSSKGGDRASTLPTEAPETYKGLRGPESPPEFVKRIYGEWLGQGLTRAHIRSLDPKLYTAIDNWLSRPGNEWPGDVDLPTLKEQNNRWVERVSQHGADDLSLREARRLEGALQRRRGQNPL